jgi:hypothetical protein
MEKVSIIGLDLAKQRADGGVGFRKKLSREKVLASFPSELAESWPGRVMD